ncbi:hypothetical protein D3C87_1118290 [compost metagenome]
MGGRQAEAADRARRPADVQQDRREHLIRDAAVEQGLGVEGQLVRQVAPIATIEAVTFAGAGRVNTLRLGVVIVARQAGDVEAVVGRSPRAIAGQAVGDDGRGRGAEARAGAEEGVVGQARQDEQTIGAGARRRDRDQAGAGQIAVRRQDRAVLHIAGREDQGAVVETLAEVGDGLELLAVAAIGRTVTGAQAHAVEVAQGLDVDHPGDGVSAIDGRGAVLQHLDALDHAQRHGVQVDEVAEAALAHAVHPAMPVDQNQDAVAAALGAAEVAQVDRGSAVGGPLGAVAVQADARRRQLLQQVADRGGAGVLDVLGGQGQHRPNRVSVLALNPRAGDDDLIDRGRGLGLWCRCGRHLLLRPGRACPHPCQHRQRRAVPQASRLSIPRYRHKSLPDFRCPAPPLFWVETCDWAGGSRVLRSNATILQFRIRPCVHGMIYRETEW